MLKNKKSESTTIIPASIVKLLLSVAMILLIILPLWNTLEAYIFKSDKEYEKSFQNFLNGIDKMSLGRETFELKLKPKSAIIGFSKNANRYECFNCDIGVQGRPTIIFNKPKDEECANNACICLCNEFQLVEGNLDGKSTKFGQCTKPTCKSLHKQDIVDRVIIKTYPGINILVTTLSGGAEYWKNGFLFTNGVSGANGLKLYSDENTQLKVEKRSNLIGVCNSDMLKFNRDELKYDTCIINEYDEAKKLEQIDMEKAVQKYKDFIAKYKTGTEVGEAMFTIGKYYFNQGKYLESSEILCQLTKEYPTISYRAGASEMLDKIEKNTVGIKVC